MLQGTVAAGGEGGNRALFIACTQQAAGLQQADQLARHRFAGIDNRHRARGNTTDDVLDLRQYKCVMGAAKHQCVGTLFKQRLHITPHQHGSGR